MVCTNLFHLGRGTSPCDRRKSQGRLRDGPLRNWFLLSSLRGITHWVRSHGRGEMLNPAQQEKAKCEARKGLGGRDGSLQSLQQLSEGAW